MKKISRFQILQIMFWGHFCIFILVSFLTHLKGFDEQEYDAVAAILLIFLTIHGYRLIEGKKSSTNKLIIIFGFQKLFILFSFFIIGVIFAVKALAPQVINFKEALISFGIFELIFHIVVFFIHVVSHSKNQHYS